jgi:hypothetical protein
MITIERDGNGFKMKFSAPGTGWRGFSAHARSVEEIHVAINHYYGIDGHIAGTRDDCPLCRRTK